MKNIAEKFISLTRLDTRNALLALIAASVVTVAGAATYGYLTTKQATQDDLRILLANELEFIPYKMYTSINAATASGEQERFNEIRPLADLFARSLSNLENGSDEHGILPIQPAYQNQIAAITKQWNTVRASSEKILGSSESIATINNLAKRLINIVPPLQTDVDNMITDLSDSNASADQIRAASQLLFLTQRVATKSASIMLNDQGSADDVTGSLQQLSADLKRMKEIVNGLLQGDEKLGLTAIKDSSSIASLGLIETKIVLLEKLLANRNDDFKKIFEAFTAQAVIRDTLPALNRETKSFVTLYREQEEAARSPATGYTVAAIAVLSLLLLIISWSSNNKRAIAEANRIREAQEEQNRRNQAAILALLEDISGLADGDLTKDATVSEDFTGAIADAFNYAIDAMRELVGKINTTTVRVTDAANTTQAVTLNLAKASRQQAEEINTATSSIATMAKSVETVTSEAKDSVTTAKESVTIAKKGADAVRRNIGGMDTIREQIQETSKRIKRLGESSQEIGEIVEFIKEIADQTNILALNASIQAAMAGEQGRGFAVVADEVQRLAERSGSATKQIENLVNTIQADTNEAIRSMERTTTEVVSGTKVAQDAGSALEEIEKVSVELAKRINEIARSANAQAAIATSVNNTMQTIREITTQTLNGANQSASSMRTLTSLAEELRKSVSGFQLPASNDA